MNKEVYIVMAYRWNDREKHSYAIGVFDNVPYLPSRKKALRKRKMKYGLDHWASICIKMVTGHYPIRTNRQLECIKNT